MPNFLNNARIFNYLSFVVLLTLGLSSCEQQQTKPVSAVPIPQGQADLYYLNAQPSTKEAIEQLIPKNMIRMDVLTGQKAANYAHDVSVTRVILAQTY